MDSETKQILLDLINILLEAETSPRDECDTEHVTFRQWEREELKELRDIIQSKGEK